MTAARAATDGLMSGAGQGGVRSARPTVAAVGRVHAGSAVILCGLAIALVGVALRFGLLSWFGRLPGDIRYESEDTRLYIRLVSMLLVSVVLSLVAWLWRRAS
jgi:hypothetical protein